MLSQFTASELATIHQYLRQDREFRAIEVFHPERFKHVGPLLLAGEWLTPMGHRWLHVHEPDYRMPATIPWTRQIVIGGLMLYISGGRKFVIFTPTEEMRYQGMGVSVLSIGDGIGDHFVVTSFVKDYGYMPPLIRFRSPETDSRENDKVGNLTPLQCKNSVEEGFAGWLDWEFKSIRSAGGNEGRIGWDPYQWRLIKSTLDAWTGPDV